jgi:hypothetical protein
LKEKTPRWAAAAAIIYLLIVNLVILMMMVLAPRGSPAAQAANVYKLTNLSVAAVALTLAVWRGSYAFLLVLATLQFASMFPFAAYVNGLGR